MQSRHVQLDPRATQAQVENAVEELSSDPGVHGVFVQLPLPPHLDRDAIFDRISVEKDVDGLGSFSLGKLARGDTSAAPATPRGITGMLREHGISLRDARSVIIGSSVEIALSLSLLLMHESNLGSVLLTQPDVDNLTGITREADIVVSCAERPAFIRAEHLRAGATVVDAGYNRTETGVTGDVDVASVMGVAGAIVPMPGGIGPATIAILLEKTWHCARRSAGL